MSKYFVWITSNDYWGHKVISLEMAEPVPVTMTNKERIKLAVEKWQMYVDMQIKHPRTVVDEGGPRTCPLCMRYFENECKGCPVRKITHKSGCEGSPYDDYSIDQTSIKRLAATKAEVKFLKKLYKETK